MLFCICAVGLMLAVGYQSHRAVEQNYDEYLKVETGYDEAVSHQTESKSGELY